MRDPCRSIAKTAHDVFGWRASRDGQQEAVSALLDRSGRHHGAADRRRQVGDLPARRNHARRHHGRRVAADRPAAGPAEPARGGAATHREVWRSTRPSASGRPKKRGAGSRVGDARFVFVAPEQLAKDDDRPATARSRRRRSSPSTRRTASPAGGTTSGPTTSGWATSGPGSADPVTVALTATAAEPVRDEISTRLRLADPAVVVRGVDRPNIDLAVRR